MIIFPVCSSLTYIPMWRIARWIESNFSLLRSKIRELHPVHRASLQTLLRHLFIVSTHSDKNGMTVKELSNVFCMSVVRGDKYLEDGVSMKACCVNSCQCNFSELIPSKGTGF